MSKFTSGYEMRFEMHDMPNTSAELIDKIGNFIRHSYGTVSQLSVSHCEMILTFDRSYQDEEE